MKHCLLLAAVVWLPIFGQEQPKESDLERNSKILSEELQQQRIGRLTGDTSNEFGTLIELLKFNRLGDPEQIQKLDGTSTELGNLEADEMALVVSLLRAVRLKALENPPEENLAKATVKQDEIVERLKALLELLRKRAAAIEAAEIVRQMIEKQKDVNNETRELAKENLGKEELSEQDQQKANKLAQKQQTQQEQLEQLTESLEKMTQKQEQKTEETKQAEQALEKVGDAELDRQIEEVAKQLEENQLASAFEKQQKLLEKLEEIQKELSNQAKNPLQDLADSLEKLNELEKKQAELQQKTEQAQDKQASKQEQRQLQQEQDQLSRDAKDLATDLERRLTEASEKIQEASK
ncbi:MAG: hypothetical protein O2857_06985, partial [Planctomycetota bacterium]|nr:hypothetical protein [Planctomycetota bacterium]